MESIRSTALERFLSIRNYEDKEEVRKWLMEESKIISNGLPDRYEDMLSLSMLSDVYYHNVPASVHRELMEESDTAHPILKAMESYRIGEARMVAIAS